MTRPKGYHGALKGQNKESRVLGGGHEDSQGEWESLLAPRATCTTARPELTCLLC